ncbi:MAG: hypothetical protein M1819_001024 [Sarea resinae]|nr:MAG: hypothetical protein M1819_001024 [Sarea resinae]
MPPDRTLNPNSTPRFDPYNSSATGHQVADNRLGRSIAWAQSRTTKLSAQFSAGYGGGRRVADTVGAGSEDFGKDGRNERGGWERGASGLRGRGQRALGEFFAVGKIKGSGELEGKRFNEDDDESVKVKSSATEDDIHWMDHQHAQDDTAKIPFPQFNGTTAPLSHPSSQPSQKPKQLFAHLNIYINGSTAPLISDHRLKHLLATHGAHYAISPGKRVTHIILGTRESRGLAASLAATKVQREISRRRVGTVRYVCVEWYVIPSSFFLRESHAHVCDSPEAVTPAEVYVLSRVLESIKAGVRLPESRFKPSLPTAAKKNEKSVYEVFGGDKRGSCIDDKEGADKGGRDGDEDGRDSSTGEGGPGR